MGFDVLLLGYISIKRGGAQHAVVHADGDCVCVMELCVVEQNRCFLRSGAGLSSDR